MILVQVLPPAAHATGARYIKSVKTSKTKVKINAGKTKAIKVTVKKKGKISKKLSVKVAKKKVAKAKLKGSKLTITGKKAGKTNVTLTTKAKNKKGKKIKKTIRVKVLRVVAINKTNFPDPVFRSYVKENFDTDSDGKLSTAEIKNATSIVIIGYSISDDKASDLSGIQYFTKLVSLDCSYNLLKSLDVSKNTKLKELSCYYNSLSSLDVSGCSALERLLCDNNSLSSLDVSGCSALEKLSCADNSLSSLNVSGCSALEELQCYYNSLSSLDVSDCSALEELHCDEDVEVTGLRTRS